MATRRTFKSVFSFSKSWQSTPVQEESWYDDHAAAYDELPYEDMLYVCNFNQKP